MPAVLLLLSLSFQLPAHAAGTFISAPSRVDMVHDAVRDMLYISSAGQVLRYRLASATFDAPFVYIDKPNDVIDTDIVFENGKYYRFSKDEKFKAITMETSDQLEGTWAGVSNFSLAKLQGFEGPACYRLTDAPEGKPATWCLLLDNYARGQGYKPFITKDLSTGQFEPAPDFKFPFKLRHGSILPVSAEELTKLEAAYQKPAK